VSLFEAGHRWRRPRALLLLALLLVLSRPICFESALAAQQQGPPPPRQLEGVEGAEGVEGPEGAQGPQNPPGPESPPGPPGDWEGDLLGTLERIDPGQAAGGPGAPGRLTPRQQVLLGLLLAAATLISEDLTCVAAGLLVSHGKLSFLAATLACLVGIFVGDLLLVLAGRLLGRRLLERAPFRWILTPQTLDRSERWFAAQGAKVVLVSRFIPGSRLPLFLAAGILRAPFARVATALLLAGVVWTPLLVGLSAWTGGAVLARFRSYESVALPAVLAAFAAVFLFVRIVVPLFTWRGRRLLLSRWRRLTLWEFWPVWLFELPVVLHGLGLGLRHRHLTIFTAANPGIPAGGFVEESKSAILGGLSGLSPHAGASIARFVLVDLPEQPSDPADPSHRLLAALREAGLDFPIVLKPDVGERGRGVAVVRSAAEMDAYLASSSGRLIAQEYVSGEEFGVFYVRHPAEARGRILSITGKRFPAVVGDGRRCLEELILADDRAVCMARYYLEANLERLDETPAAGERVQLVEIGNHCRGTVFLDARQHRTPELEAAIETLARGVEGFYFGRFDLRAPSVDHFRAGLDLKVLELNGVTSEATHIYAPGASLLAAYRTLFEQWRLAFEIGAANVALGAPATGVRTLFRLLRRRRGRFASMAIPATSEALRHLDPDQE
jgi:membrane protein DedA with SNARE-associated domain